MRSTQPKKPVASAVSSPADAALAAARLNVEQLRAAYSQALAQQKLATNDVAYQEGELKRQQSLASKGIATRAALDETTRNLTKARDTEAAARQAFDALAAGGSVQMPLGPTFWSPCYGMVTDRFNVGWMVMIPGEPA